MFVRACVTAGLLGLCSLTAQADTYRVDLIVFQNLYAASAGGLPTSTPAADAIALTDTARLSAAGIRILSDSDFALQDQWVRLRSSSQFRPLVRLAWTQVDPPAERGPSLQLRQGTPFTVYDPQGLSSFLSTPIDGSVALHLSRYLHLDVDAMLNEQRGTGAMAYRLNDRRRMRRDELHHLDSPKLGVLAKVTRIDATAAASN
ncbi:MAG: peptidoglycan binding protein CsiV [Pseudomonadota bacterium]|nr:peptidoglycan binding protein CsiV [Pseudomonadota bacterium]